MKKSLIIIVIATLFLCLWGCDEKIPQDVLTFDVTNNDFENKLGYYSLLDDNNKEFGQIHIQLGQVETDDKGVVKLDNNEKYILTIYLDPHIGGQNIKCYYNNTLMSLSKYDSYNHIYDFDFTTGSSAHNIRVDGISKDEKRKMSVTLPISDLNYSVYCRNADNYFVRVTAENNKFELDYGSNLVFKVQISIQVEPSWNISYEKEDNKYIGISSDEETKVENDRSKIFTLKVDDNFVDIKIINVEEINS